MKSILYVTAWVALTSACAAFAEKTDLHCSKIIDMVLNSSNYGSFDHPRAGVTKTQNHNGSYTIDVPGGAKVTVADGSVTYQAFSFAMTTVTSWEFDSQCNYTSVSTTNLGGYGGYTFATANPTECRRVRGLMAGMIPMPEMVELGWCNQYFPLGNATSGTAAPANPPPTTGK